MTMTLDDARTLDERDPLAAFRERFVPAADDNLVAYFDGNSLGRPPRTTRQRLIDLLDHDWGTRLIRGWSDGWLQWPTRIGDELAAAALGAAPGQTVVADSTTVCLYKALRAAVALRGDRDEIITDVHNFPTDRYIVDGIAQECGLTVRWVESPRNGGVEVQDLAALISDRTAVVTLSHVAYQSAHLADMVRLTQLAHDHGAVTVWDLCHSVGSVPLQLDADGADFAVGCTYKFLNAGPGAPAFLYVRDEHLEAFHQPITGWIGTDDIFAMGPTWQPAPGIRQALSGTPPITGMIGVDEGVKLVAEAGIDRIRAKAVALTEMVVELVDAWLVPAGMQLASPRDPDRRGAHVTVTRDDAEGLAAALIDAGVIIDFRQPDGIRIGLSPLSTGFAETWQAMELMAQMARRDQ